MNSIINDISKKALTEGVAKARELYVDTGKISTSTFDRLAEIDPSPNKKYIEWMTRVFVKNNMHHVDVGKFEVLRDFYTLVEKGIIKNKDINSYLNIEQVYDEVKKHEEVKTSGEIERQHKAGAEVVFENDKCIIIRPTTREASCYYGKGTKWCTSGDVYNYFNSYHYEKSVNLYYIIVKGSKDKYAVAVYPSGKKQYFDAMDNSLSASKIQPILKKLGIGNTKTGASTEDSVDEQITQDVDNNGDDMSSLFEQCKELGIKKLQEKTINEVYDYLFDPKSFAAEMWTEFVNKSDAIDSIMYRFGIDIEHATQLVDGIEKKLGKVNRDKAGSEPYSVKQKFFEFYTAKLKESILAEAKIKILVDDKPVAVTTKAKDNEEAKRKYLALHKHVDPKTVKAFYITECRMIVNEGDVTMIRYPLSPNIFATLVQKWNEFNDRLEVKKFIMDEFNLTGPDADYHVKAAEEVYGPLKNNDCKENVRAGMGNGEWRFDTMSIEELQELSNLADIDPARFKDRINPDPSTPLTELEFCIAVKELKKFLDDLLCVNQNDIDVDDDEEIEDIRLKDIDTMAVDNFEYDDNDFE